MKTLRKIFTSLNIKYLMGSLVIFSFATVWYSCNKDELVDQLLTFDVSQSDTLKIPFIPKGSVDTTLFSIDIPTNAKQKAQENGTNTDLIKKATLKELKLTIIQPDTQNFNFLDTINIYLSATGLNEILLAGKTNIPADTNIVYLDTYGSDFVQYIKQDTFALSPQLVTKDSVLYQIDVLVELIFSVTADPLK